MAKSLQVSCIQSGYMFRFEGTRRWRGSSSERWETIANKAVCGRVMGRRKIDDSQVVVVRARPCCGSTTMLGAIRFVIRCRPTAGCPWERAGLRRIPPLTEPETTTTDERVSA